ncbi:MULTISPECIES: uracil-DNA glycosylase [pseudomallei group]|uniref:uracil-DNA glycosylase n=1 Tax=pseudomallei group TaxID=111527 RepID=UPI000538C554|nr:MULTISPECIES: uracil-DNA glycosylase [pseudomallei group]KGV01747.1 uracil DNA glycosylase superfamily protein [Burkholderia pseudomallei MSHR4032]KGW87990.1 uracil DNA glycosylase superfamily protein [Burkholderia pseudomallei MSHR332]MCS3396905.1 uracil-DNA glycosylase [Burkholderia thailandensis]MUV27188.1 uracil-DNA glycosylase [Burkholderia thailandensis]QIO10871.1 uracil-DNA glycosylase [Burkholderia thailandensis]
MRIHPFVEAVASLQFEDCFNPYTDRCDVHDRRDAPRRRAVALSAMLRSAAEEPIDAIWIGRDLGYRGGRRTGLALTDDVHMVQHARRWNIDLAAERPTVGNAVAERTAAVIWNMLEHIDARIFLWNVFPLHPHEAGDPFTNRQHNARERRAGEELLQRLIVLLRPARIVAIGNDAAMAAQRITDSVPVVCVRHPSYGGQTQFQEQIAELYGQPARTASLF